MKTDHTISMQGQMLIEILIGVALLAILLPVIFGAFITTREGKPQQQKKLEATLLMQETYEQIRVIREGGWDTFAREDNVYHIQQDGTSWDLIEGSGVVDGFTQSITLQSIRRDSSGAIIPSGGFLDPSTREVTISISWSIPRPGSVRSTFYLTRYHDNASITQTTVGDFTPGVVQNTTITDTVGGEITLASGGRGDWCKPQEYIVDELDLPDSGVARDVLAIEGKAFTGKHAGSSGNFLEIGISNEDTPTASIQNIINGYETNDIFIDENYAYVATGDVSRDVVIVDLATNQEVGYYNDSNLFGTAQGVFVKDNVGFVTIGFRLHSFDLSSKSGSRPELDSVFLGWFNTGYRLFIVGDYAYIAVDWGWSELRLVNISNPYNLDLGAKADVNGERGQEVYVNATGTRAYLATDDSGSRDEFFIINTDFPASSKNSSSFSLPVISSQDSGGMDPRGITVAPGNIAIMVGVGGEEYQVYNLSNENDPQKCGGIEVDSGIYGVSAVLEQDGDAFSYVVTGDGDNEFKIIEGGPGGQYASTGNFESSMISFGYPIAFNRLSFTYDEPNQTDLKLQVAVASPEDGNCSNAVYTYVGPDGTSSTFFEDTTDISVPFGEYAPTYQNPGLCFRYKVYLETLDYSSTPVFHDITINYSP